jgi:M-phase phosphoprotein 6
LLLLSEQPLMQPTLEPCFVGAASATSRTQRCKHDDFNITRAALQSLVRQWSCCYASTMPLLAELSPEYWKPGNDKPKPPSRQSASPNQLSSFKPSNTLLAMKFMRKQAAVPAEQETFVQPAAEQPTNKHKRQRVDGAASSDKQPLVCEPEARTAAGVIVGRRSFNGFNQTAELAYSASVKAVLNKSSSSSSSSRAPTVSKADLKFVEKLTKHVGAQGDRMKKLMSESEQQDLRRLGSKKVQEFVPGKYFKRTDKVQCSKSNIFCVIELGHA